MNRISYCCLLCSISAAILASSASCQSVVQPVAGDSRSEPVVESAPPEPFKQQAVAHYRQAALDSAGLSFPVYYQAYTGYLHLKSAGKTNSAILVIVDFNLPSAQKRMWVIQMEKDSLLMHTWTAHGKGSGLAKATRFSNTAGSLQSSLGFYLTAEQYIGKNGRSLRLDGLDTGFNDLVRKRYVVLHGAPYVSQDTLNTLGYMGNSEGCFAVTHEVNPQIISWLKPTSVIFATGPGLAYHSRWLKDPKQPVPHSLLPKDTP